MSQGSIQVVQTTVDLIMRLNPESFLDVGVGSGKWGMIFREYTDIWEGRTITSQWKTQIDGIEIFAPVIQDYQKSVYGRVFVGNAYTLVDELHSYDFVWAFSLLAAFEKSKGKEFLKKLREKAGTLLGVWQTLEEPIQEKSDSSNPYDAKVSSWSLEDFKEADFRYYQLFDDAGRKAIFALYTEEDLSDFGFKRF